MTCYTQAQRANFVLNSDTDRGRAELVRGIEAPRANRKMNA